MSNGRQSAEAVPKDVQAIKNVLQSMGVTDYEPAVVTQLLNFMYRYTVDVLQDAEAFAERAGRPRGEVGVEDVMLAVQAQARHSFQQPPPQDVLLSLADSRNHRPLPAIPASRFGLQLPPEAECLLTPNTQLVTPHDQQQQQLRQQQQR